MLARWYQHVESLLSRRCPCRIPVVPRGRQAHGPAGGRHAVPITSSAPVVVAERVSDLTALLVLAIIGVALRGVATSVVWVGGAVVGLGLIVLAWPSLAQRLIDLVTTPALLRRLRDPMTSIYRGIPGLCRPRRLAAATAIGIVAWLCECIGFAVVVGAFPGVHVDVGLAILIYAATTIAGALSFLPGGLGVTEGAMTMWLVQSAPGIDTSTALAAVIVTRVATLWFAVAIGLVAMVLARRKIAGSGAGKSAGAGILPP